MKLERSPAPTRKQNWNGSTCCEEIDHPVLHKLRLRAVRGRSVTSWMLVLCRCSLTPHEARGGPANLVQTESNLVSRFGRNLSSRTSYEEPKAHFHSYQRDPEYEGYGDVHYTGVKLETAPETICKHNRNWSNGCGGIHPWVLPKQNLKSTYIVITDNLCIGAI